MQLATRVKPPTAATKPRVKMLVFGATFSGKTYASIWPDAYILDTEQGTVHYDEMLAKNRCARQHTTSIDEAIATIQTLITGGHDFRTLVIDPITTLYEDSQHKWIDLYTGFHEAKGEKSKAEMQDFGPAYWGKVKREQKRLIALLKKIDMNVVVTAHEKDKYESGGSLKVIGATFDAMRDFDYHFDVVLRLVPQGKNRKAYTLKDRTHRFPDSFDYDYETIRTLAGEDAVERKAEAVVMATAAQLARLDQLLESIKIKPETISAWFRKAQVEDWGEMDSDTIGKCITYLEQQIAAPPGNGGNGRSPRKPKSEAESEVEVGA